VSRFRQTESISGIQARIVVVDNSGDYQPSSLSLQKCDILNPQANLGYLGGCEYGLKWFLESTSEFPEWTIVCNTDVSYESLFLKKICSISFPQNVACLAPGVTTEGGVLQNPFIVDRPSNAQIATYCLLFQVPLIAHLYIFASRFKERLHKALLRVSAIRTKRQGVMPVYAPDGCVMVLSKRFFLKGGSLSYKGFMYGEEIHIAEQARRHGMKVLWMPELQAHHYGGEVLSQQPVARRARWLAESLCHIKEAYFSKQTQASEKH
jgi:GT2 family glycosyltransferase